MGGKQCQHARLSVDVLWVIVTAADLLQKVEEDGVLEEHLHLLVGDGDWFILQGLAHFAEPARAAGGCST